MYLYNEWCIFILSVKEVLLTIIRTFYPVFLYLIFIYCKLYKYLIIYFTAAKYFRFRLMRNCKRIKAKKATFSRIKIIIYKIDLINS